MMRKILIVVALLAVTVMATKPDVKVHGKKANVIYKYWEVYIDASEEVPKFQFWKTSKGNAEPKVKGEFQLQSIFEMWLDPCILNDTNADFDCPCVDDTLLECTCYRNISETGCLCEQNATGAYVNGGTDEDCLCFIDPYAGGCPCNISSTSLECNCITDPNYSDECAISKVGKSQQSFSSHLNWTFYNTSDRLTLIGVPEKENDIKKLPFEQIVLSFLLAADDYRVTMKFDMMIQNYEWAAPDIAFDYVPDLRLNLTVKFKYFEVGNKSENVFDISSGRIEYRNTYMDFGSNADDSAFVCDQGVYQTFPYCNKTNYDQTEFVDFYLDADKGSEGGIFYIHYMPWETDDFYFVHDPSFGLLEAPSDTASMAMAGSFLLALLLRLFF